MSDPVEERLRAIADMLMPLLLSYGCDEPHWDETAPGYYPEIPLAEIKERLATGHFGDCTNQPVACVRCHAEAVKHEAEWIAERLLSLLADASPQGAPPLDDEARALTAREAVEERLRAIAEKTAHQVIVDTCGTGMWSALMLRMESIVTDAVLSLLADASPQGAPPQRLLILDRIIHDMRMHEGLRPRLDELEAARAELVAAPVAGSRLPAATCRRCSRQQRAADVVADWVRTWGPNNRLIINLDDLRDRIAAALAPASDEPQARTQP